MPNHELGFFSELYSYREAKACLAQPICRIINLVVIQNFFPYTWKDSCDVFMLHFVSYRLVTVIFKSANARVQSDMPLINRLGFTKNSLLTMLYLYGFGSGP